jgi:membrane fusion protein, heavy metal efflux system
MKYSVNTKVNRWIILSILCLSLMLWGCGKNEVHNDHDCSEHSTEEHKIDHSGHNHAEGEHNSHEEKDGHSDCDHSKEPKKEIEDDHSGHDHQENNHTEEDAHSDCDHSKEEHPQEKHKEEEEDHSDHGHSDEVPCSGDEEIVVELTDQAMKLADVKLEKVKRSKIATTLELPGEIAFNDDNVAHITPRYAGIAKEVHTQLGKKVNRGDVLAVIESNESLSHYNVIAPIDGHIIEKNITNGEFLSEEDDIYVIADLETVWVNCDVYPKNGQQIKVGQKIKIKAVGTNLETEGRITYVAPVYNGSTRSAIARAVISSQNMKWKPGMFVYASIEISSDKEVLTVSKNSVQVLDEKSVVFIPDGKNEFIPNEVTLGINDEENVEIISGISADDLYVSNGAFEIKAKIVTESLGEHAGHGH